MNPFWKEDAIQGVRDWFDALNSLQGAVLVGELLGLAFGLYLWSYGR